MAVEPYLIHVIWDIDPDVLKEIKDQGNDDPDPGRFILRFHDVTGTVVDSENDLASFDVAINVNEKKRYIPLRHAGRAYFAELGTITAADSFFPIARSNVTETPRVGTTPETESRFDAVHEVAVQEYMVIDMPRAPLSLDCSSAEKVNAPAMCWTMNDKPEKTLPGSTDDTRSILARDVLKRPSFFHRPRLGAEQVFWTGIFAIRVIQERGRKPAGALDLTERSEKTFIAGISSK